MDYKYNRLLTRHIKKQMFMIIAVLLTLVVLLGRVCYISVFQAAYYEKRAEELHQRERRVKAKRGRILDRNGQILAGSETVCTVSVIHSQIEKPEEVIKVLSFELDMPEEKVAKKVNAVTSMEYIKTNVDEETGDAIREYGLAGVKVDEDYKRVYPYSDLASKVLGFTGADNQGILGLEAKYEKYLSGEDGYVLTSTDAAGIEIPGMEELEESQNGKDLYTTLDLSISEYATQLAKITLEKKNAKHVSIIVMNPKNGEILAMVNEPEYDLNNPFELLEIETETETESDADSEDDADSKSDAESKLEALNQMWRNFCINDTYEPGSIFKTLTATAAIETGAVDLNTSYTCSGSTVVSDRRIRCHKTGGHGTQSFVETVMNSCNPAFIEWGRRVGVDNMYAYMGKLGLLSKTGIDISGEAGTIIHKQEDVGPVELATMSFGQSFQITPMQMLRAVCAMINGGNLVTPHFAMMCADSKGIVMEEFYYSTTEQVIKTETSDTMREILFKVVEEGGGNKAYIEGYEIGGKTATSQKLPRGSGKYISSFIGFAPADDPQVIAMCLIDEPEGTYYGGTIAAPVIKELFENILPYLDIEKNVTADDNTSGN